MKSLLKEDGVLYLMTGIYNDNIDFSKWWYKNDLTHVFIFTRETFFLDKDKFFFLFDDLEIKENLIRFKLIR